MRAVVQRTSTAEVRVSGASVASSSGGLLVLLGVADGDGPDDARAVAAKIAGLRIFSDNDGRMNHDVAASGGSVIVVSQFTLVGDVRKGRRPSFTGAAAPDVADQLVGLVVDELRHTGLEVSTGTFGAHMEVELVNDGPVTIVVESRDGLIV